MADHTVQRHSAAGVRSLLLGEDVMADWRARTATGTTRLRSYYDIIPDEYEIIIDSPREAAQRTRSGYAAATERENGPLMQ